LTHGQSGATLFIFAPFVKNSKLKNMENIEEKIKCEIEALRVPCQYDCGVFRRLICLYDCDKLKAYQKREEALYGQLQDFWFHQSFVKNRKKNK
jgi:hypothetical protein